MNLYFLIAINGFLHPIKWLNSMFHKILLLIDGAVYWAVSQTYQIFIKLADARIFQDAFFSNFAKRIYAIIGVVMLFYLAYALLTSLVDPDKATSGEKSLTKLAQNIVISLVILGLLPTLFDYAYKIQGIVFKENVIGAIIFGTGTTNSDSISKYGNYMAFTALNPFLNPANYNVRLDNDYSWFDLKAELIEDGKFLNLPILGDWAVEPQELISQATDPPDPDTDSDNPVILSEGDTVSLTYVPPISTACGIVLLYIIFSFCLDLGVRIVKFAFCQLIAPIPVVLRMVPGKKGTFDKWLKLTLTVYFEVFIRVAIMYLVIYFFSEIANMNFFKYATSGVQGLIVLAIILMGLLAFAKQAPKMLGEMLGLDSGNIKLGIKDKLKAGGFFAAGSAVGAAVVSHGNPFAIGRAWRKGMQDGNFRSIGQEALNRAQVLTARGQGSTWAGRRVNDVRRMLGYDTLADQMDRNAQRRFDDYVVNGHHYTKQQLDEMRLAQKSRSDINTENIRNIRTEVDVNQRIIDSEKSIRDRAIERIERVDANEVNETIRINGDNYGEFTGNYSELRNWIEQLDRNMAPQQVEMPPPPVAPRREDFTTQLPNNSNLSVFDEDAFNEAQARYTTELNDYNATNAAAQQNYAEELRNHTEIMNRYREALNTIRNDMRDNYIDAVLDPNSGVNDNVLTSRVNQLNDDLNSIGRRAATTAQELATNRTQLQNRNNALNRDIHRIEIDQADISNIMATYDRAEAVQKEQVDRYKQSNIYRSASASRDVGKKG